MATSRLISFTSPVRPKLSKEESPDPETGPPDEDLHFDKEKETVFFTQPGKDPAACLHAASTDKEVQLTKGSSKLTRKKMHSKKADDISTKSSTLRHPTLLPLVLSFSVVCLGVTVATTVAHIVLDTVIGAAIILAITCPIIGWGVLSLVVRKPTLVCVYGFLLIFETMALFVAGGLEAKEFITQLDLAKEMAKTLPANPSATDAAKLAAAQRKTKLLAAFTGLYFACALVFIITAIFDFHYYGEVSLTRTRRRHKAKGKEQEEKTEEKKKEGAVRVPQHRAPSPDLLDAEELLDV